MKGTVLLSPEGINLFVAGPPESIRTFIAFLHTIAGLEHLVPKASQSAGVDPALRETGGLPTP